MADAVELRSPGVVGLRGIRSRFAGVFDPFLPSFLREGVGSPGSRPFGVANPLWTVSPSVPRAQLLSQPLLGGSVAATATCPPAAVPPGALVVENEGSLDEGIGRMEDAILTLTRQTPGAAR